MDIDIPGTGISFLMPVSSMGGIKALQFLTEKQEFIKEEEKTLKNTKYELLVTIANQGYIELIMDAARNADAAGGTVIHAKGTGMERAEKFFGVSLAAEKEVIFIVAKKEQKNKIMKSIMEKAGTKYYFYASSLKFLTSSKIFPTSLAGTSSYLKNSLVKLPLACVIDLKSVA